MMFLHEAFLLLDLWLLMAAWAIVNGLVWGRAHTGRWRVVKRNLVWGSWSYGLSVALFPILELWQPTGEWMGLLVALVAVIVLACSTWDRLPRTRAAAGPVA